MFVHEEDLKDFLIDSGLLTRSQLAEVSARVEHEKSFYHALAQSGILSDDELRRALAKVSNVPFVELLPSDISTEALMTIPEPLARTRSMVGFAIEGSTLHVALLDLSDLSALQSLPGLRFKVTPHVTDRASMKRALIQYQQYLKEKFGQDIAHAVQGNYPVRLVDALLSHAASQQATGVHIEPGEKGVRVRYRIGEKLHDAMTLPLHTAQGIAERLKLLGSVVTPLGGESVRLRFNTLPTPHGEKIFLNLAREAGGRRGFTLEALGFHGSALEAMYKILASGEGLILVGGDAQSGKTTLLYTMLDLLNNPQTSLATVEDRIEYSLPHVSQAQAQGDAGLTTVALLRAALKGDADTVAVSDVSDAATARLCVQAASQGKLVIATLRAPETMSTLEALREFEVHALALGTVLKGVVATELVRKLCPHCKQEKYLTREEARALEPLADFGRVLSALKEEGVVPSTQAWKDTVFYSAVGCSKCEEGYQGYAGLQEVAPVSSVGKELLIKDASIEEIALQAREEGVLTLAEDGLFKAAQGITSIEEILRRFVG
jgi:type IV pilus assembly protein PilB